MKKIVVALAACLMMGMAISAVAVKPNGPSAANGLSKGKSDQYHLYLYEKDANWMPVENGSWGKMNFDGDSFVFNGHCLTNGTHYALIHYVDPWPGSGGLIGDGYADENGNVHIKGMFNFSALMSNEIDDKIWLVLYDDYNATLGQMVGWNPTEYLFEYNVI